MITKGSLESWLGVVFVVCGLFGGVVLPLLLIIWFPPPEARTSGSFPAENQPRHPAPGRSDRSRPLTPVTLSRVQLGMTIWEVDQLLGDSVGFACGPFKGSCVIWIDSAGGEVYIRFDEAGLVTIIGEPQLDLKAPWVIPPLVFR